MAYKLAFLSEHSYVGKVPADEKNLRTDITFMKALGVDCINWNKLKRLDDLKTYDAVFVLIPKSRPIVLQFIPQIKNLTKLILFQEGPSDYYMDWSMQWQYWYLKGLSYFDAIFCHNEIDKKTFEGLCNVPCYVTPSLIDLKRVNELKKEVSNFKEEKIIVGGNCIGRWYNGTNSVMAASETELPIYLPSMGQRQENEAGWLSNVAGEVKQFPYIGWTGYMKFLSTFRYAIHLMPLVAANSFSLNCAALGIPCIGTQEADVQKRCFPELSIDYRDVGKAKKLLKRVIDEEITYHDIREHAREQVKYYDINNSGGALSMIKHNLVEVIKNGSDT